MSLEMRSRTLVSDLMHLPSNLTQANISNFSGRQWVLPAIVNWFEQRKDRLFLLTGGPGTGKSLFTAWLAGSGPEPQDPVSRQQLRQLRSATKAAHFCQASSRSISPHAMSENMANQLMTSLDGFAAAFASTSGKLQISVTQNIDILNAGGTVTGVTIGKIDIGMLGDELSFDRALVKPLEYLDKNRALSPILLLVDALDEALLYTGITIPDLLSRIADLPAVVRILATSRDDPRVLKFFRNVVPFDLLRDAPADVDDVDRYVRARLSIFESVPVDIRDEFAIRLTAQAQGNFLYATMVLDALQKVSTTAFPDLSSHVLTDGLSGLYRDFLTRELSKDENLWFTMYEPLLGMIAVAQGDGLGARQIGELLKTDVRAVLRACKQYLTGSLPEGPFRLFHKSFVDFLLDDPDNLDFHIDASTMHQRLADFYRVFVENGNWHGIDDYGLMYLAEHLFSLRENDTCRSVLYQLISWPCLQEKRLRFGQHQSFAADLLLMVDVARCVTPRNLAQEIRGALAFAVLDSLTTETTRLPKLMAAVVRAGSPETAITYTEFFNNTPLAHEMSVAIANVLVMEGQRARAEAIWLKLIENSKSLSYVWDQVYTLHDIARELGKAGEKPLLLEILHIAEAIEDDGAREHTLVGILPLVSVGEVERALTVASNLTFDATKAKGLAGLASALIKCGQTTEAAELASQAWEANERHYARWTKMRLPTTTRREYSRRYSKVKSDVVRALALTMEFDDVLSKVRNLDPAYGRKVQALCDIAVDLAGIEQDGRALQFLELALTEAGKIDREWHGWRAFADVASAQARLGKFEQAINTTGKIRDLYAKVSALCDISRALSASGQTDQATEIAMLAFATSREIENQALKAEKLEDCACALADCKQNDAVFDVIDATHSLTDDRARLLTLAAIARRFAQTGDVRLGLHEAVQEIDSWVVPLIRLEIDKRLSS